MEVEESPAGMAGRPPTFRSLLRNRSFSAMYFAEMQSLVGDQFARVALSILVFDRTGSAVATALTYAASFLPAVVGGFALSWLGERYSSRAVLVGCDLTRTAAFVGMTVPGVPLPAMVALLVVAVCLSPVFSAAQVSYLAAVLEPEQFRIGTGLRMITNQLSQVVGFALGGVVVVALSPRGALLLDALSFLVSAGVIATLVPRRDDDAGGRRGRRPHAHRNALGHLWRHPRLRALVGLCWLAGFLVVPEGLAVPFADRVGATTTQTGFLFASIPLGGAMGAYLLMRRARPGRRERTAAGMAIAAGLPLLVSAAEPPWELGLIAWALSGALSAYQAEVVTLITQELSSADRSRLLSAVSAGLIGAQGLGLCVFGVVADVMGPGASIALAGGVSALLAALLWFSARPEFPRAGGRAQHRAAHAARRPQPHPRPVGPTPSQAVASPAESGPR